LAAVGLLAWALETTGGAKDVVFAHMHNLVAVLLWWAWRARRGRAHWFPLVLYGAICGLLLSDFGLEIVTWTGGFDHVLAEMDEIYQVGRLSPGIEGGLAVKLVLLYTFAQTLHYVVWLALLPDEDRARRTPPTFASRVRSLWRVVGGGAVIVTVALVLGLAIWSMVDLMAATHGYFRMAHFHGHLELAAAAVLWMEAGRR
jgi:hypothetical protein